MVVSITCASLAGTKGDVFLLLSNLSLSVISFIKVCNIHFSSFSCKKDIFFCNNLLLALTSIEAVMKNLKSAFGRIVVPISLPSKMQPPNFFLFKLLNYFCLLFKIFSPFTFQIDFFEGTFILFPILVHPVST